MKRFCKECKKRKLPLNKGKSVIKRFFSTILGGELDGIGGWLMHQLGIPAPYLLGSIFATWLVGSILKKNFSQFPELAIPRWFQVIVLVGLSTLIGAAFNPEMS